MHFAHDPDPPGSSTQPKGWKSEFKYSNVFVSFEVFFGTEHKKLTDPPTADDHAWNSRDVR